MKKQEVAKFSELDSHLTSANITDEMEGSFISYAMNVIFSRALPDVRDGLKPVQRRILYAMFKLNINWKSTFKKSARIVGEVIGKYHPHGDSSVYQAMVRMAQDFSLRYPLIKGQGNFGSIDGDPPAAMRYTEVKMSRIAGEMVRWLSNFNVEFKPNYDDSEEEPLFLTSFIPNLLINGASGIAVGIATSIPPHNLGEVVDGLIYLIKNPDATVLQLMKLIKGADFPGGADIYQSKLTTNAYLKGKGSVLIRAKFLVEQDNKGTKIIFTNIPFKVNKSELLIKIADLINKKVIKGITNLHDESSRHKVRIVLIIHSGYNHQIILERLFKLTNLQTVFYYNLVALVKNQPRVLNLKQFLKLFLEHQNKILISQTKFNIQKTKNRNEILTGLSKALSQIDLVVDLIRNSTSSKEAITKLIARIKISQKQAEVVLETKLSRLTSLEIKKIKEEILLNEQNLKIWTNLLGSQSLQDHKIIENLEKIKDQYNDNRLSKIHCELPTETSELNLVPDKNFILVLTEKNYVKKLDCELFKIQHRGGKGIYAINRFKQVVKLIAEVNSRSRLYFFTEKGKVFTYLLYKLPAQTINAQGTPINNLIDIDPDDDVCAIQFLSALNDDQKDYFFVFLTAKGWVKKIKFNEFMRVNRNGKIAMRLRPQDKLISVIKICQKDFIVISSSLGRLTILPENQFKLQGRLTMGLKGISCGEGVATSLNKVSFHKQGFLLLLTDSGYGKKILLSVQKTNRRTNKGLVYIKQSLQNAHIIKFSCQITDDELILVGTKKGKFIKIFVSEFVKRKNKTALGTKIINLESGDKLRTAVLVS